MGCSRGKIDCCVSDCVRQHNPKQNNMDAIANFHFIQQLPLVQELIAKNRKLKKRNKELKNLVRLISGNLPLFETKKKDMKDEVIDILDDDEEHIVMTVEDVKVKLEDVKVKVEDVKVNVKVERTIVVKDEPIVVVEQEEVVEEEVVEEQEEEEQEEEEEEEEEEEQEEEQEEEEEDEETEEVFEVIIKGKTYYTTDEKNGAIYAVDSSGDIGDEVGRFTAGVAVFA